ncbi:hypothetical protein M098_0640 [Phocaeicola vulgatus str. 3775 SR(B) 19]|nr:hypothetical protein M098_0640 [Phocaeicola vulgatus str. 3775 SR(B) 19]
MCKWVYSFNVIYTVPIKVIIKSRTITWWIIGVGGYYVIGKGVITTIK